MMSDRETMKEMERVLGGKPIDEVAPILVVAVARALVLEANGDVEELRFLVSKFSVHLVNAVNDMMHEGDGETRQ